MITKYGTSEQAAVVEARNIPSWMKKEPVSSSDDTVEKTDVSSDAEEEGDKE
jgi:hypothetical protein